MRAGAQGRGTGQRGRPHSLNFHSWRHMGQCCCTCCAFSHLRMQCMWKQCEHWPHTSGQSSPGTLPAGGTRGPVSHPEHRTSPWGKRAQRGLRAQRGQESGKKPRIRPSSRLYMNLCKDHPGCFHLHAGAALRELSSRKSSGQGRTPTHWPPRAWAHLQTHCSSAIWHP